MYPNIRTKMNKKPKIFTIGGATFDIFVKAKDQAVMSFETPETRDKWLCLKHGGKIRVQEVLETFGGGATNTAVAFARMGFDTCSIIKIGSHYGERVVENLKNEGVCTDFVRTTDKDRTGFSTIINTFDGDRTVLAYAGANQFFGPKDLPLKDMEKADWIYLNHLSEDDMEMSERILSVMKKNPKIKLVWNPGKEQLVQGVKKWRHLLEKTEVLLVNKEEATLFTKVPYQLAGMKKEDPKYHIHVSRNFLPPYADNVCEIMIEFFKYGVKNVVITDGRSGAQASDGEHIYFCPVVSTKRVDTLGAGDSFGSGVTSAMILGKDLKTALIYGTLNANSVVNQYGAQGGLLTKAEMEKRFKSQDINVTSATLVE